MFAAYARFVIRFRYALLACWLGVLALAISRLPSFRLDTSIHPLLEASEGRRAAVADFRRALPPLRGNLLCAVEWSHAMGQAELDAFVQAFGLPGDQWPEASSLETLKRELARIRDAGMAQRLSEDGEAIFLAWPVFGPGGRVWASLLVTLPTSRYHGEHQRQILSETKAGAQVMSQRLLLPGRRHGRIDPI